MKPKPSKTQCTHLATAPADGAPWRQAAGGRRRSQGAKRRRRAARRTTRRTRRLRGAQELRWWMRLRRPNCAPQTRPRRPTLLPSPCGTPLLLLTPTLTVRCLQRTPRDGRAAPSLCAGIGSFGLGTIQCSPNSLQPPIQWFTSLHSCDARPPVGPNVGAPWMGSDCVGPSWMTHGWSSPCVSRSSVQISDWLAR